MNIKELIFKFNDSRQKYYCNPNKDSLFELNLIANELLEYNNHKYNEIANEYIKFKNLSLSDDDKFLWNKLIKMFKLYNKHNEPVILDVGSGSGRDLVYATNLGFNIIGIDNNSTFIRYLNNLISNGILKNNSIFNCDMLNLVFKDNSFDILRYNASLLHMPITDKGYMCDKALEEAYRVIKSKGLLFITVKYGSDVQLIDENDGMGCRIYQLYDKKLLNKLCSRNFFQIKYNYTYFLNNRKILAIIAQKVKNV